jgi:hypothetical protein
MAQIDRNNCSMAILSEICTKIVLMRHILTIVVLCLFAGCRLAGKKAEKPLNSELLPAGAAPLGIRVTDLNYWTEQGQLFVTGVCVNESGAWEQAWLNVSVTDEHGTHFFRRCTACGPYLLLCWLATFCHFRCAGGVQCAGGRLCESGIRSHSDHRECWRSANDGA